MKLEMKLTVNIAIELITPLPCAAHVTRRRLCRNEADKGLATLADFGTWEIVPLCNDCWQQVESQLVSD